MNNDLMLAPRELLELIEKSWRVPDGCPREITAEVRDIIGDGLDRLRSLLAATAVQSVDEDAERAAFESFHIGQFGCKPFIDDKQTEFRLTHWNRWQVWKARAALAAPTSEDEGYPPCDYCGIAPDHHPWHGSGLLNGVINKHIHACDACRSKLPAHAPVRAVTLPAVDGDELPALDSTVLICLGRSDTWVPHTVVGYYVWGNHAGDDGLHRVFVRVRDADGYLNARLLKDVRKIDEQPAESES